MQLGNVFTDKKCARCREAIVSDPAFENTQWYHRVCLEKSRIEIRPAK